MDAESRRIPVCILIDTSGSMRPHEQKLKNATKIIIETLSNHDIICEKVDLGVITFNTDMEITIAIEIQELYNLLEDGKLKADFESCLDFKCSGGTPTGYALRVAIRELRYRYELLKHCGKAPCSPILLVISGGSPSVAESLQVEHDRVLAEELDSIRCLVSNKRLIVYVIEFDWQQNAHSDSSEYKLMQDITGLDNDERIIRYAEDDLKGFFKGGFCK